MNTKFIAGLVILFFFCVSCKNENQCIWEVTTSYVTCAPYTLDYNTGEHVDNSYYDHLMVEIFFRAHSITEEMECDGNTPPEIIFSDSIQSLEIFSDVDYNSDFNANEDISDLFFLYTIKSSNDWPRKIIPVCPLSEYLQQSPAPVMQYMMLAPMYPPDEPICARFYIHFRSSNGNDFYYNNASYAFIYPH